MKIMTWIGFVASTGGLWLLWEQASWAVAFGVLAMLVGARCYEWGAIARSTSLYIPRVTTPPGESALSAHNQRMGRWVAEVQAGMVDGGMDERQAGRLALAYIQEALKTAQGTPPSQRGKVTPVYFPDHESEA